jgi:phage terminase large subunit-like protein
MTAIRGLPGIANARLKETADGAYITKDGRNSPRKIDLIVAAVIAFERAQFHAGQDEGPILTMEWV